MSRMDEIFVDIELIDEIVVDALQDDEVSATIEDADEIEIKAFDYPPEIDQLNSRVAACEENSQNAVGLANAALETATESAVLAATASEAANSAGNLAALASQAAQEAAGIAEGAATTAGEAAQATNNHLQIKTNPHLPDTTQEFAEVNITGLKSDANGGSIPAVIYNWFKGLFTSLVDGSVKSYIVGILTILKDLAARVGLLEDKYILRYVVPVDTTSITLTADRYGNSLDFSNDSGFDIIIEVKAWAGGGLNRLDLRFNGISSNIYFTGTTVVLGYIYTQGSNYASQYSVIRCEIHSNEVFGVITGHSTTSVFYPFHTEGFNSSSISSITLSKSSTPNIPAGAVIIIKKR